MTRRPADRPQFIDGVPLTATGEGRLRSARLEDLPILSEMEKAQFTDLAYPFFASCSNCTDHTGSSLRREAKSSGTPWSGSTGKAAPGC
jgi:hypothetical protein